MLGKRQAVDSAFIKANASMDSLVEKEVVEDADTLYKKVCRIRSRTVELVLVTLLNFLNMRRVNTRGIDLATKHVMMAALYYNLKKYMKYKSNKAESIARVLSLGQKEEYSSLFRLYFAFYRPVFV